MLGENIKRLRKAQNLTQKQLADKTGLTGQIISNIERGYSNPNHEDISKISVALKSTPNELLGIKETAEPEALMFNSIDGFKDLPLEEQKRIEENLIEQALFMIERAKKK